MLLPLLLLAAAALAEDESCGDALAEAQDLVERLPDAEARGALRQALATVGAAQGGLEARVAALEGSLGRALRVAPP